MGILLPPCRSQLEVGGQVTWKLPGLQHYISVINTSTVKGFTGIPGWMYHTDVVMFDHLLDAQLHAHIRGDILEIGCYQGKSAIVLGYGLRPNEHLVVNDLFEEQFKEVPAEGLGAYEGLTKRAFKENYGTWHQAKPPTIYTCPSSKLSGRLAGHVQDFRFIHIDAGHAHEAVATDIQTACNFASPMMPIVVLDDYRTAHTPGVSAAAWDAVGRHRLFPFALTEVKMYAALSREHQQFWQGSVSSISLRREDHIIHGLNVLRVWE